jgi:hypothetical protein
MKEFSIGHYIQRFRSESGYTLLPRALPSVDISFEGIMQGIDLVSELLRSGRESLIFNDADTCMRPFVALEDALAQLD